MTKRIIISLCLVVTMTIGVITILVWPKSPPVSQESSEVSRTQYVSLGDSVSSGLGLASPSDTSGCGRTKEAYPYRLAAAKGLQLVHLACSGATLEAGINGPQIAAGEQISQRTALFQREPGLITLGIGANDVAWLSLLSRCLEVECGTDEDKATYESLLRERIKPQLRSTLEAIAERYGEKVQLVVVGYYQVFPRPSTNCPDTGGLNEQGLKWARELRARLNNVISETVKEARIGTYIEIDFSGHELCMTEPWVQGLDDPAPYHANAAGQKAIARQIEEVLRD